MPVSLSDMQAETVPKFEDDMTVLSPAINPLYTVCAHYITQTLKIIQCTYVRMSLD